MYATLVLVGPCEALRFRAGSIPARCREPARMGDKAKPSIRLYRRLCCLNFRQFRRIRVQFASAPLGLGSRSGLAGRTGPRSGEGEESHYFTNQFRHPTMPSKNTARRRLGKAAGRGYGALAEPDGCEDWPTALLADFNIPRALSSASRREMAAAGLHRRWDVISTFVLVPVPSGEIPLAPNSI